MPAVDVGFGTTVRFMTSGFSANLLRLELSSMARRALDIAHMSTAGPGVNQIAQRPYLRGKLVDPGQAVCHLHFNPNTNPPIHQPPEQIVITFPLGAGEVLYPRWQGSGFLTSYTHTLSLDDTMIARATIKFTAPLEITVGTSSDPLDSPLLTNLVAFWKLQEAVGASRLDSVGTNHLTQYNSVGQIAGKVGNAASFNGTTQRLDIADTAALSMPTTQQFTIAGWLNITTLVSGATPLNKGQLIFTSSDFEYALQFVLDVPSGEIRLRFMVSDGSTNVQVPMTTQLSTGTWHFIVAWYDGFVRLQANNGTIYTAGDGTFLGSADGTKNFNLASSGSGGGFFAGSLDAWGIWKRVLTSTERTQLWNSGNGLEYPF